MNSRIDQISKGLLSTAVILMFTAALIAGQARANLPAGVSSTGDFSSATRMSIILDKGALQKFDSLPLVVDTILALPIDIELRIGELTFRKWNSEDAGPDSTLVQ